MIYKKNEKSRLDSTNCLIVTNRHELSRRSVLYLWIAELINLKIDWIYTFFGRIAYILIFFFINKQKRLFFATSPKPSQYT